MPIRRLNPAPPVTEPTDTPSLWDRIGGWTGAGAAGTRAITGVASAEGGIPGAAISGLGELGAETLEGSIFKQSPLRSLLRIGTAAGLGAVPFGAILKQGRPLASAARGAVYSGGGAAATEAAAGEPLDPGAIATSAGLGGVITGGLAKLLGKAAPKAVQTEYELQSSAGRPIRTLRVPAPTDIPLPAPAAAPKAPSAEPAARVSREVPYSYGYAGGPAAKSAAKEAKDFEALQRAFETSLTKKNAALDKLAAKEAVDQEAAEQIAQAKLGRVPQPPQVRESISAPIPGGRESMSTVFKIPEKEKAGTWTELGDEGDLLPSGTTTQERPPRVGPTGQPLPRQQTPVIPPDWQPPYGNAAPRAEDPGAVARAAREAAHQERVKAWVAHGQNEAEANRLAALGKVPPAAALATPEIAAVVPTAKYAFDQPGVGPMYHVVGGPFDRSTVGAAKLTELGIPVPETTAPVNPLASLGELFTPKKAEAPPVPLVTQVEPPPVSPKVAFAKANFSPEANARLDSLAEQYASETDPILKRGLGAQMSAIDRAERARLKAGATPAEPGVAPASTPSPRMPVEALPEPPVETSVRPSGIGPSQTAKAREAALAKRKAQTVPAPEGGTPPAEAKKFEALFNKLRAERTAKEGLKGEKGEIDPAFLAKLGLGAGGALVGATQTPEDRLKGAVLGGAAGLSLAYVPQLLQSIGAHPGALQNLTEKVITPEGIKTTAKRIWETLPQIQRFNYLTSAYGLPANMLFGPYGSAVMGAIEHMLAGDPRGWQALKALHPVSFAKKWNTSRYEAAKLIAQGELGRSEGLGVGGGVNLPERILALPGVGMAAGDVAARDILQAAGFTELEARRITLTSEPELQLPRAIANFGRGQSDITKSLTNIILPFRRTPANIWEQGMERFPGLGFLIQADRKVPDPIKQQIVQQLMSTGVAGTSGLIGANLDPETAKQVKRYVTNFAGQYSLPATMGFAAGQAYRGGKPMVSAGVTSGVSGLPLPTTQPLSELAKWLSGTGPAPSGATPALYRELTKQMNPDVPARPRIIRRLRNQ